MKKIKSLKVVQIKIFPPDYIPYFYLLRPEFIDQVTKRFKFQKHAMPFNPYQKDAPKILHFNGGEFNLEGTKILIQRLHFEDRRIILEALTSSNNTTKIFNSISKEIKKFDPLKSFESSDAQFETQETDCVALLNVDYSKIYSKEFNSFISKEIAPILEHKFFDIRPKALSFEIHFEPDEKLSKNNITLSPKTLTIEPSPGHTLEEKLFYSKSPFDSDTHFKLLNAFEKEFAPEL